METLCESVRITKLKSAYCPAPNESEISLYALEESVVEVKQSRW